MGRGSRDLLVVNMIDSPHLIALTVIRAHQIQKYIAELGMDELWSCKGCEWKGDTQWGGEAHVAKLIGDAIEIDFTLTKREVEGSGSVQTVPGMQTHTSPSP